MISDIFQIRNLELFFSKYGEVILVAPTGAGKTTFLLELFEKSDQSILYLSPLRALADECYARVEGRFGKAKAIRINKSEHFEKFSNDLEKYKKRFAVATIEHIHNGYLEHLAKSSSRLVIILDESHLVFHWGQGFRPHLYECYYEIRSLCFKLISLTATLSDEQSVLYKEYVELIDEATLVVNLGNYGLKTLPQKINFYHETQKKYIYKDFWRKLNSKKNNETFLVFVAFRNEVDELIEILKRQGVCAIGCVSGEVDRFKNDLLNIENNKMNPDVIVATTCLSHGVNLPSLSAVFLFYPIQHRDFWVQMVGRAGRRGETFEVYEMNGYDSKGIKRKPRDLKLSSLKNSLRHGMYEIIG